MNEEIWKYFNGSTQGFVVIQLREVCKKVEN